MDCGIMASSTVAPSGRATTRTGLTRRAWLLGASTGIGALVGRQYLLRTSHPGPAFPAPDMSGPGAVLDDASQLCPTRVATHFTIRDNPRAASSIAFAPR
jgi:hypothetical protein